MGRRVGVIAKRLLAATCLALVLGPGLSSCQFPSYDFAPLGGAGGSAAGSAGTGGGGSTADSCQPGQACFSLVPEGWLGPVALWQAATASVEDIPDCPEGYDTPSDVHAGLRAPDASCDCTCSSTVQQCQGPLDVFIHNDLGCQNRCATPAADSCASFTTCSSAATSILALSKPPAGSCIAQVDKTTVAPEWRVTARLCELASAGNGACESNDEACVPLPAAPFSSQVCVYRVVLEGEPIPTCPAAYPRGPQALYSSFSDDRECGACTCEGPTGGSCGGKIFISDADDCSDSVEYTIGSGCQQFMLDSPPESVEAELVLTATGTCSVAARPQPIGQARPSGSALVVCCP